MIMFYPVGTSVKCSRGTDCFGDTLTCFTHRIDSDRGVIICAHELPTIEQGEMLPTLTLLSDHGRSVANQVKRFLQLSSTVDTNVNTDAAAYFLANYPEIISGTISSPWSLMAVTVVGEGITLQYSCGTEDAFVKLDLPDYGYECEELTFGMPAHSDHIAMTVAIRKCDGNYMISQTPCDKVRPWIAMTTTKTGESMEVQCFYPVQETERVFCDYRARCTDGSLCDLDGRVFYCY